MQRNARGRLALAIACVLVIALLALQVWTDGPVARLDQALTLWLAAHRSPALTRAMLFVSAAHQTGKLLGVTVLLGGWLALRRDWTGVPRLLVVPTGMLLNTALKNVFQRPRPHLEEPLVQLASWSFPSGHAAASTVFYGAVCALVFAHARSRAARGFALVAAIVMVPLVMFSRIYLGAHYLSDVIAGAALGVICLLFFAASVPPVPAADTAADAQAQSGTASGLPE